MEMRLRLFLLALGIVLLGAACGTDGNDPASPASVPEPAAETDAGGPAAPEPTAPSADPAEPQPEAPPDQPVRNPPTAPSDAEFGPAPVSPTGPLGQEMVAAADNLFGDLPEAINRPAILTIGGSQDPRLAWLLADLLRFIPEGQEGLDLISSFEAITGVILSDEERRPGRNWLEVTNRLIAWDVPEPPDYLNYKRQLFTLIEPGWQPFFADEESNIDWRWVSWGGVLIDDRELGDPIACERGCIPALDDPAVTDAAGGSWYSDDAFVFGVVVNGEARAYPKHIMEIHEMINDTLGDRRIGMPYCTLCGSAQAYFTDIGEEDVILRTSGLLTRSNKVMYDLGTLSVFDTFTGEALSGALQDAGVVLEQVTVATSTWGEWKAAHPDTTIVAEDGGIGRDYPLNPLGGRDDNGPIFPVGDVDPRLSVHDRVVGVTSPEGTPVAFPTVAVRLALEAGEVIEAAGVLLETNGGGFRATDFDGNELVAHESFWFAWSQFMPDTDVWTSAAP
ncbi:MAG: DUF3179 domain-containing (seleno)protein [Gaiellaceae bacterium]